jgi:Ca-activated chloride channel family protein
MILALSFRAGHWLLALLAVAALLAGYLWVQLRGRRQAAVRFTNLELLASVAPKRPGWRRHVAAALLLASLAAMTLSLARPVRAVQVPRRSTVILVLDVSISMQATDVEPSRFAAAKAAAKDFASSLPSSARLGLVSFAGKAHLDVAPTADHQQVVKALDGLQLEQSTAIGDAVLTSLQAIGRQTPATIVLLSDGTTTVGTPDTVAGAAAAAAKVKVTTIAFGTDEGTVTFRGQTIPVPVGREELAQLAKQTSGRSFEALSASELKQVYDDIRDQVGYRTVHREATTFVLGAALLLGLAAAAAALAWTSRLP